MVEPSEPTTDEHASDDEPAPGDEPGPSDEPSAQAVDPEGPSGEPASADEPPVAEPSADKPPVGESITDEPPVAEADGDMEQTREAPAVGRAPGQSASVDWPEPTTNRTSSEREPSSGAFGRTPPPQPGAGGGFGFPPYQHPSGSPGAGSGPAPNAPGTPHGLLSGRGTSPGGPPSGSPPATTMTAPMGATGAPPGAQMLGGPPTMAGAPLGPGAPGMPPAGSIPAGSTPASVPIALPRARSRVTANMLGALGGLVLVAVGLALTLRFAVRIHGVQRAFGVPGTTITEHAGIDWAAFTWTVIGAVLIAIAALAARWASWTPIAPGIVLTGLSVWAMSTPLATGGAKHLHDASTWAFDHAQFALFCANGIGLMVGLALLATGIAAVLLRMGLRREIRRQLARR